MENNFKGTEDFNELIETQIKRVQEGIGIDTEIALLKDLKRMTDLGVLKIHQSTEIPEIKQNENKVSVEYRQPRLMFYGEVEIARLKKDNAELLERYKRMEEALKEFMKVWNEDGEGGEIQMKTPIAWHRVLRKIEALNINTNK
jgi:hypothetical protein